MSRIQYLPSNLLNRPDAPAPKPGGSVIGAAINSEWIGAWWMRQAFASGYEEDPNFDPQRGDGAQFEAMSQGLDPSFWPAFNDARSFDHAMKIKQGLLSVQESRRTLADAGWAGSLAQIGANIVDPVQVVSMFIPGAGPYVAGSKAARWAYIAKNALAVGLPNMALEASRQAVDPQATTANTLAAGLGGAGFGGAAAVSALRGSGAAVRALRGAAGQAAGPLAVQGYQAADGEITARDVVYGALINGAFGAGLGAVYRPKLENLRKQIEKADVVEAGGAFTRGGEAEYGKVSDKSLMDEVLEATREVDEVVDEGTVIASAGSPDPEAQFVPPQQKGAVGGIQGAISAHSPASMAYFEKGPYRIEKTENTPWLKLTSESVKWAWVRFGMLGRMGGESNHPLIRMLGNALFEDPIHKSKGGVSGDAVESMMRRRHNTVSAKWFRSAEQPLNDWYKANYDKYGWLGKTQAAEDFFTEVTKATRRWKQTGVEPTDPHVNKVMKADSEFYRDQWAYNNEMGTPGFDLFRDEDGFIRRSYRLDKMNVEIKKYGRDYVEKLFSVALMNKQPLSYAVARKLASDMVAKIMEAKAGFDVSNYFAGSTAAIEKKLRELPLTETEIQEVLSATKRDSKSGLISTAMHRVDLDELATLGDLSFEDLLENNSAVLFDKYMRQTSGAAAVSELYRAFSMELKTPIATFEQLKTAIMKGAKEAAELTGGGLSESEVANLNQQMARAETAIRIIQGFPEPGHGAASKWSHAFRQFNFFSDGASMAFSQIPDFGVVAGQAGFPTIIRALPALQEVLKNVMTGKAGEMVRSIEAVTALGTDAMRHSAVSRMTSMFDDGERIDPRSIGGRLSRASNLVSKYSGLDTINRFLQLSSAVLAEQKWIDYAKSGKLPSKARLAQMGMTEADATAVIGELKKHMMNTTSPSGRPMVLAGLDQWDPAISSKFVVALDKWTRSAVQQNDLGQSAMWMTSWWGKMIMQFRNFTNSAWEKQLLRGAATFDLETFQTWGLSMILGALSYTALTYAKSMGRKDKEEFLKKNLDTERLTMAAIGRAGWTSYAPMLWDTVAPDKLPRFAGTRSSSDTTSAILGNPTARKVNALFNTVKAVGGSVVSDKRQFSQRDFDEAMILSPLRTAQGIIQATNALRDMFPKTTEQR